MIRAGPRSRRGRTIKKYWRNDVAVAVLLIAAAFVPGIAELGLVIGELQLRDADRLSLALLFQAAALVIRRRWPALRLAITGAAFSAYQIGGYPPTVACLALLVALYSVGTHQQSRRRTVAIIATLSYAALALTLHANGSTERLIDYLTFFAVLAACWGAGSWVRARQAEEARKRRESVSAASPAWGSVSPSSAEPSRQAARHRSSRSRWVPLPRSSPSFGTRGQRAASRNVNPPMCPARGGSGRPLGERSPASGCSSRPCCPSRCSAGSGSPGGARSAGCWPFSV
ncbi:hypothetical protein FB565_003380 [Actinoplanes lutulentus]|nr:hypothetical protein [Actinoplanes lutulentus]MBB2943651.1 hypothetical protein [Actinoplanes lutulentus]